MTECDKVNTLRELCEELIKERARFKHYLELEEKIGFFNMAICKRALRELDRSDKHISSVFVPEMVDSSCLLKKEALTKGGY